MTPIRSLVRTSPHKSLSPRWTWTEEVYFTRHSLSPHLTVFYFWCLLSTDVTPSNQKAILRGKKLCNITRDRPPGTLAFAFLNCKHMFISEGWIWSHSVLRTAQRWQCKVYLSGRKASYHMDSSPEERPLLCQNYTQYNPFSEQTVIPKLAFQAGGCLTQSRYFANPPNHGYDVTGNCCLHQVTDKLLKTPEMTTRPAVSVNECSVVSIHLFPKSSRSESRLWWVEGTLTIPAIVSELFGDHKITSPPRSATEQLFYHLLWGLSSSYYRSIRDEKVILPCKNEAQAASMNWV